VFEFHVDSISTAGLVLGGNGNRDIPVGTEFTALRQSRLHKVADGYRTEELGEVGQVALVLREVHLYQRTIDYVPRGHAAGLAVNGEGVQMLADLLRDLPPSEYLTLVATEAQDAEQSVAL